MKIAIIHTTLTDDSKKSAKILKELINTEVVLISIDNVKDICLLKYNFIILGASTYYKVQGSFKKFISRNIKTLLEKPYALYVNSDENLDIVTNLNKVYSTEIIESSIVCSNFGYNISTDIGNFIQRRKSKKIIENNETIPSLNKDKIEEFAKIINELIEKRVD
ncbi:flavodoxin domain-containing protein [uncultured Methanobrevibacter sp.]|uniref:flavodoxin domain-containing protein n=1 Tax=uncultured Methanobrevibacter sp. TaxID=253161 RepID=UPI0025EDDF4C|nr:flavodoxin domain-containing protein [uncultured Methanobrevibacter sp.]